VHFDEPLKIQAIEFLRSLQDGKAERSGAASGLRVVEILEAIVTSMRRGGSPTRIRP
jgi:hypothetical protein